MMKCPYCAEQIKKNEKVCPYCGLEINQMVESKSNPSKKHSTLGKVSFILPILLAVIYILGFFIIPNRDGGKLIVKFTVIISIPFLIGFILSIVEIIRNLIKKTYRIVLPILGLLIDFSSLVFLFIVVLLMMAWAETKVW